MLLWADEREIWTERRVESSGANQGIDLDDVALFRLYAFWSDAFDSVASNRDSV